jgi:hypothetical protein
MQITIKVNSKQYNELKKFIKEDGSCFNTVKKFTHQSMVDLYTDVISEMQKIEDNDYAYYLPLIAESYTFDNNAGKKTSLTINFNPEDIPKILAIQYFFLPSKKRIKEVIEFVFYYAHSVYCGKSTLLPKQVDVYTDIMVALEQDFR